MLEDPANDQQKQHQSNHTGYNVPKKAGDYPHIFVAVRAPRTGDRLFSVALRAYEGHFRDPFTVYTDITAKRLRTVASVVSFAILSV